MFNKKITIRPENKKDFREVELLTREAFWDVYKPGCDEYFVLHNLRNAPAFVRKLDYLACDGDMIVGNIVYSEAKVINNKKEEFIVLCMGPFAVLPGYQKKGIGKKLLNETIEKAKGFNYKAIIIFGNPEFYHKFGFKNAKEYNIQTADGQNFEPFMALELSENSLKGIEGKFYYDPCFEVKKEELELFEKEFPYREKHVTNTQLK